MEVMKKLRPPFWFSASLQAPERQNEGFHGSRPRQPFPRPAVCRFWGALPSSGGTWWWHLHPLFGVGTLQGWQGIPAGGRRNFPGSQRGMDDESTLWKPTAKTWEILWMKDWSKIENSNMLRINLGKHLIWKFRSFTKIQRSTSICPVHGLHNNPTTSNKTQQIKQQNKKTSFRRLRRCYV